MHAHTHESHSDTPGLQAAVFSARITGSHQREVETLDFVDLFHLEPLAAAAASSTAVPRLAVLLQRAHWASADVLRVQCGGGGGGGGGGGAEGCGARDLALWLAGLLGAEEPLVGQLAVEVRR